MLRNLTLSVLRYERVKTTEAKAKEVRLFVDRMEEGRAEGRSEREGRGEGNGAEEKEDGEGSSDLRRRTGRRGWPTTERTTPGSRCNRTRKRCRASSSERSPRSATGR